MIGLPEIPDINALVAILSAGLLLWAAFCVVRWVSLDAPGDRKSDPGPLTRASYEVGTAANYRGQLAFIGSLFAHLFLFTLIPWLQWALPGPLPIDIKRYDLVVLQFRMPKGPLLSPAELSRLLPRRAEPKPPEPEEHEPVPVEEVDRPELESPEGEPVKAKTEPEPAQDSENSSSAKPERKPETAPEPKPEPQLFELASIAVPQPAEPDKKPLMEVAEAMPQVVDLRGPEGVSNDVFVFVTQMGLGDLEAPGEAPGAELTTNHESALVFDPELVLSGGERGPGSEGAGRRKALSEFAGLGSAAPLAGGGSVRWPSFGDGTERVLALILGNAGGLPDSFGIQPEGPAGVPGETSEGAAVKPGVPDGRGHKLTPMPRKAHGIILISDIPAGIPEASDVLRGNPIYTVYVDVPNSPAKWTLQFCAQESEAGIEFADGVIRIVRKERLDPPYALYKAPMELPENFTPDPSNGPRRIVVYAAVDEDGTLHDLRILRSADPETDNTILASLQQWEFLPAFQGEKPVAVEAVFGIPLL